jgi:cell wall-associated NlpC family hydrolase
VKEGCSCFTKIVLRRFKWLPDSPVLQFQYGHKVRSRSNLKRGDLVFFKERGRPITHVGMCSGYGYILHASSYFGSVVNSKMKYIRGTTAPGASARACSTRRRAPSRYVLLRDRVLRRCQWTVT